MIRLKNLLTEESAKTYTTKQSWTLKTTKNTWSRGWDVVLNIPAGTTWKLLRAQNKGGAVIETTTPIEFKLTLQSDPKVYKYNKKPVKAAIYKEGFDWTRQVHILIATRPEIFPDEYHGDLTSLGLLGARSVWQTIEFDVDTNPHAEDLFYNLYQTFT